MFYQNNMKTYVYTHAQKCKIKCIVFYKSQKQHYILKLYIKI